MAKDTNIYLPDGSFDWSGGVDSGKVTTLQSTLNPNGLARNQLAWLNNATVRDGGITQRYGWQPLLKLIASGYWQGGFLYEPDGAYPYLVCQISGILYSVLLVDPYTVTDLTLGNPALINPSSKSVAEMAWFCQGENYLIIQAGDYYTNPSADPHGYLNGPSATLPLIWDGTTLRRSIGIQNLVPTIDPHINEIPAAGPMCYYGGHIWYSQGRQVSAGDMVGGPSGAPIGDPDYNHFRDSILSVTENPLCFGGDGFSIPTNSGNIRALTYAIAINAPQGQGAFLICTRKDIYALTVPTTRTDWINANASNQPTLVAVQIGNGPVGDRCIVQVNGDVFYMSHQPDVRSLIIAQRYFQQWANAGISQNVRRAMANNDRSLMRFSSGMNYANRMWELILPELASDGLNVIHKGVIPLDFDVVSSLSGTSNPVWEGAYSGLNFVQIFSGDFGGLQRAFAVMISDIDGTMNIWELSEGSLTENGDNRITWAVEFPAFTWSNANLELQLKRLSGCELWVDKVTGTAELDIFYREDADPCWHLWTHRTVCAGRCGEQDPAILCYPYPYPQTSIQAGYVYPIVAPEAKGVADSMGVRPTTNAYQFQCRVVVKGYLRIKGLILYAYPLDKPQFQGIAIPSTMPQGMAKLPNPFANNPAPLVANV